MTDTACRRWMGMLGVVMLAVTLLASCGGHEGREGAVTGPVSQIVLNLQRPEADHARRLPDAAAFPTNRQMTAIARLRVDVHVPDQNAPITAQVDNLRNDSVVVELSVPQGPGRQIDVRAFNRADAVIYEGTTRVDLMETVQNVTIDLEPVLSLNPLIQADIEAATGALLTAGDNAGSLSGLTVTIPPGAFERDTFFTLGTRNHADALPRLPRDVIPVSPVLGFEAMGESLIEPASITFPYRIANADTRQLALSEEALGNSTFHFFVLRPGDMRWQSLGPAAIDTSAETITAPFMALGDGVIGRIMNTPPMATAPPIMIPEDTVGMSQISVQDPDNNQVHTFAITQAPASGMADVSATGLVTYTPNANAHGPDTLTVTVTDSGEPPQSAAVEIPITITPENDLPTAQALSLTTREDTPLDGRLSATDIDGDPLTFHLDQQAAKGMVTLTDPAAGLFTYVPDANLNGPDQFTFYVSDGLANSAPVTVGITITPVNDPPVANPLTLTTLEDTAINGSLTASDIDGDPLTFRILSQGTQGVATITNAATGAFTYTPNALANGPDAFTFDVSDGQLSSNPAVVTISIASVNNVPVAQDGTLSTTEDLAANGMLRATDADGDTLTFTIVSPASLGTVSITNAVTGAYTYTPNPDANGSDAFTFRARDGLNDSNIATVLIDVLPAPDAPVAMDDLLNATEDLIATGVLPATDVDGDALTFSIVSQGTLGTVSLDNPSTGAFTYTPNPDVNGPDTFTFRANDGALDSNTATVNLSIAPVNDAPIAFDRTLVSVEVMPAPGTLMGMDVDGDPLTFSIVSQPGLGATATLIDMFQGTYLYDLSMPMPPPNSFTYQVNDGTLDSNVATVTVDPPLMPYDLIYAARAGGSQQDEGIALEAFANGSVVVTGFFEGTMTLGQGSANATQLISAGKRDIFIAKYLADGTLAWARQVGSPEDDEATGVIARLDDTVVVTGSFHLSATFGAGEPNETILTSAGWRDIFVALYDPNGVLIWARRAGGSGNDLGQDITPIFGQMGDTVITGSFETTATFGPGQPSEVMLTSAGQSDIFIAKYDAMGQLQWATRAGGSGNDEGLATTTRLNSDPVVTGSFETTATFGASEPGETMLTSNGSSDVFIATYDYMSGMLIWAVQGGGSGEDAGTGVAVLMPNDIVVTGAFENTATFVDSELTTMNLTSAGGEDLFLVRYDQDALIAWAVGAGGSGADEATGIISLPDDTLAVTGAFENTATFGPMEPSETMLTSNGLEDIFIARYNFTGEFIEARGIGGEGDDEGHDITALLNGQPLITGAFESAVTFGPDEPLEMPLTSEDAADLFLARFFWVPIPR